MKLLAIDEQKSQAYESNLKPKNNRTSFSMLETTFSGCSTKQKSSMYSNHSYVSKRYVHQDFKPNYVV